MASLGKITSFEMQKWNFITRLLNKANICLLFLVLIVLSSLKAYAVFGSPIASPVNNFKMKYLDFSLVPSLFDSSTTAVAGSVSEPLFLGAGGAVDKIITVVPGLANNAETSVDYKYDVEFIKNAGHDAFCKALNLRAVNDIRDSEHDLFTDGTSTIVGARFNENPKTLASWVFTFSLPEEENGFSNAFCKFKIKYTAYQIDLNGDPLPGGGLNDDEEEEVLIESKPSLGVLSRFVFDTHVEELMPDMVFGTLTGDNTLIQVKSLIGDDKRIFLKFNYNFPPSATISSAKIKLYKQATNISSARQYGVHTLTSAFSENGTTFNAQPSFHSTPLSTIGMDSNVNEWVSFDVTTDVQSVVAGSLANHGWMIQDQNENSPSSYYTHFVSARSKVLSSFHPVLEVTLTAPAAPNNCPTPHSSECVLINEVYANVGSPARGGADAQWVELYNTSSNSVDISGWHICDQDACDRFPSNLTPLLPGSFALVSKYVASNQNSEAESAWQTEIPPSTLMVRLVNSAIGYGLSTTSEKLSLKNSANQIIDELSYGANTSAFNPSAPYQPQGSSLARVIKGYDNNVATDFLINSMPNPGTNPLKELGFEVMRISSVGASVTGVLSVVDGLPFKNLSDILLDEALMIRKNYQDHLDELKQKQVEEKKSDD